MKKNLVLVSFIFTTLMGGAQSFEEFKKQQQSEYNTFRTEREKEYEVFREKVNKEYADLMRQQWEEMKTLYATPTPTIPEPPAPTIKDPHKVPTVSPIIFDKDVVLPTVPITPPVPIVPISIPQGSELSIFRFDFYGTECRTNLDESHRFTLTTIDEDAVATMWEKLSNKKYNAMLNDCLRLRKDLNLCDWGYYKLTEKMSFSFFTAQNKNEARLLQLYILTQSGYKVRMARSKDDLVLLLPFNENLYEYPYVKIDGVNFYVMDAESKGNQQYMVYKGGFPNEQIPTLSTDKKPLLSIIETTEKTFSSTKIGDEKIRVSVNENLINYYNDFPHVDWDLYVKRSLSQGAGEDLYMPLKQSISNKTDEEAANILIDFVQNAFEYKTDDEQFGNERPLFADETLFYPYCDCEDRSILYAILIKELLDLDVVLLHYPNHIATAVHFKNDVEGDFLNLNNKKFIVCDPTYINANVGEGMPQFKHTKAKVVVLN